LLEPNSGQQMVGTMPVCPIKGLTPDLSLIY